MAAQALWDDPRLFEARGVRIVRSRLVRLMCLMGLLPEAPHIVSRERTQDVSVSIKKHEGNQIPRGLCDGHYVHPHGKGLLYLAVVID